MAKPSVSLLISSLLAGGLMILLKGFQEFFVSSEKNTILGGFVVSLIFVGALTAVSSYRALTDSGVESKWLDVIIASAIAQSVAATVHRVVFTSGLLMSAVMVFYSIQVSQHAYKKAVQKHNKQVRSENRKAASDKKKRR